VIARFLRTLRHLTVGQAVSRLRHEAWLRVRRERGWFIAHGDDDDELRLAKVRLPPPPPAELAPARAVAALWQQGRVAYLGEEAPRDDWRCQGHSRLFRYERHYHSELPALALQAAEDPGGPWVLLGQELVDSWSRACPPEKGDAWEPYPTARRILNWAEATALEPRFGAGMAPLLAYQLEHLERHLERHLLGNHLLCDAAALVAGGSLLAGPVGERAAELGSALLGRELRRQVLGDGGYAERTVQYHALVLRDALLAAQLAKERGKPVAHKTELSRLAAWLSKLRRDDGSYPLQNDAAPAAAAVAREALRRAALLGLCDERPVLPAPVLIDLPDTGWTLVRDQGCELLFDRGPIGPREQPGHGHSDALAYELCWSGVPVVTDSGVTVYQAGPVREFERSARAHATVSVDGQGVDEPWSSFRVGGRGRVERLPAPPIDPRARLLWGRARSFRGWQHDRWLCFWPGRALLVFDRVRGQRPQALVRSHVPLDPAFAAAQSGRTLFLLGPGGRGLQLQLLTGEVEALVSGEESPRDGWVGQGFGRPVPRTAVTLRADPGGLCCYALLAPGVGVATVAQGLHLRAPGAGLTVKTAQGVPA
jgi:hypothetical protein